MSALGALKNNYVVWVKNAYRRLIYESTTSNTRGDISVVFETERYSYKFLEDVAKCRVFLFFTFIIDYNLSIVTIGILCRK